MQARHCQCKSSAREARDGLVGPLDHGKADCYTILDVLRAAGGLLEVDSSTMSTSRVLQHLYSLNTSSPDLLRYLYCLIQNDDEEQHLSSLQGPELAQLVDFLDEVCAIRLTSFQLTSQTL